MTVEQICLLVALNLLVGSFIARLDKFRSMASTGLILIAMILIGFAMIWRSFML